MKYKLLLLSLAILSSQANAFSKHTIPNTCPSLTAINAIGINELSQESGSMWMGTSTNSYETNETWTMAVFIIGADNENNAMIRGKEILASLATVNGPRNDQNNTWTCTYMGNQPTEIAVAFTPSVPQNLSAIMSNFRR